MKEVVNILDAQGVRNARSTKAVEKATRKARVVKTYKNPHNGETIETKGGNHRLLKEWKQKYGAEQVESWVS